MQQKKRFNQVLLVDLLLWVVDASDIGLGAGAVIGSGVIGYLGHKLISGLTYPFHHYLGPGNPLEKLKKDLNTQLLDL